jgi:hypothetical protein
MYNVHPLTFNNLCTVYRKIQTFGSVISWKSWISSELSWLCTSKSSLGIEQFDREKSWRLVAHVRGSPERCRRLPVCICLQLATLRREMRRVWWTRLSSRLAGCCKIFYCLTACRVLDERWSSGLEIVHSDQDASKYPSGMHHRLWVLTLTWNIRKWRLFRYSTSSTVCTSFNFKSRSGSRRICALEKTSVKILHVNRASMPTLTLGPLPIKRVELQPNLNIISTWWPDYLPLWSRRCDQQRRQRSQRLKLY